MNQRIQELLLEAQKSVQFLANSEESKQRIVMERFAELIVRKCADVAKETRWAVPPSQEQIARGIKQHFGVEE